MVVWHPHPTPRPNASVPGCVIINRVSFLLEVYILWSRMGNRCVRYSKNVMVSRVVVDSFPNHLVPDDPHNSSQTGSQGFRADCFEGVLVDDISPRSGAVCW